MVSIGASSASSSSFDPAAHLHKQGWKGKGTALKQGHSTRPLAVVQKRTLAGIGKDRDEAVPFWDQIFASTAASIFTPTPSGSSSPVPQHAAHTSTRSWVTASFSPSGSSTPPVKPKPAGGGGGPSTQARVGKEMARKGLYSRFLRGKTIIVEPEPELEVAQPVASSSTAPASAPVEEVTETKEERRARRAARRAEKEAKKATAAAAAASTADVLDAGPTGTERKKEKRKRKEPEGPTGVSPEEQKVSLARAGPDGSRKKSRRKSTQIHHHGPNDENAQSAGNALATAPELPSSISGPAVQAEAERKAQRKREKEERRRSRQAA